MGKGVELDHRQAEDMLRMLTALSAILHAAPLPERLYETLEPAIGPEIIRYGNPLGVMYLKERVDELRALMAGGLGDNLMDDRLKAKPPRTASTVSGED